MSNNKQRSLERVIKIAAYSFAHSPISEVSIRDIAAKARCSLATIYDIFGSKEHLCQVAIREYLSRSQFRFERTKEVGGNPLLPLLRFLEQRVLFLMDPRRAASHRLLAANAEMFGDILKDAVNQERARISVFIAQELRVSIEAGYLREVDIEATTYVLMACTMYGRNTDGLFTTSVEEIDTMRILKLTMSPFLTGKGRKALFAYVRSREDAASAPEAEGEPSPLTRREQPRSHRATLISNDARP